MTTLTSVTQSANTLLKRARRFGGACTMVSRAGMRDLARILESGKSVLVECGTDYFFVTSIDDGTVRLRDLQTGESSAMSVPEFARAWYVERGDVRFGRLIAIDQPSTK